MEEIDLLTVILGAAAFFVVGMVWYGVVFAGPWTRAMGRAPGDFTGDRPVWLAFVLTYAFALLIAVALAYLFAMIRPSPVWTVAIATGCGACVMVPAAGIRYLYLNVPGTVFAIDTGFFLTAMAAMGEVFAFSGAAG